MSSTDPAVRAIPTITRRACPAGLYSGRFRHRRRTPMLLPPANPAPTLGWASMLIVAEPSNTVTVQDILVCFPYWRRCPPIAAPTAVQRRERLTDIVPGVNVGSRSCWPAVRCS